MADVSERERILEEVEAVARAVRHEEADDAAHCVAVLAAMVERWRARAAAKQRNKRSPRYDGAPRLLRPADDETCCKGDPVLGTACRECAKCRAYGFTDEGVVEVSEGRPPYKWCPAFGRELHACGRPCSGAVCLRFEERYR